MDWTHTVWIGGKMHEFNTRKEFGSKEDANNYAKDYPEACITSYPKNIPKFMQNLIAKRQCPIDIRSHLFT
jgi:hypothetical protein